MNSETFILILEEISKIDHKFLTIELDSYDNYKFKEVQALVHNGTIKIKQDNNDYISITLYLNGRNIFDKVELPFKLFRPFYRHIRFFNKFKKRMEYLEKNKRRRELDECVNNAIIRMFPDLIDNSLLGDDDDK